MKPESNRVICVKRIETNKAPTCQLMWLWKYTLEPSNSSQTHFQSILPLLIITSHNMIPMLILGTFPQTQNASSSLSPLIWTCSATVTLLGTSWHQSVPIGTSATFRPRVVDGRRGLVMVVVVHKNVVAVFVFTGSPHGENAASATFHVFVVCYVGVWPSGHSPPFLMRPCISVLGGFIPILSMAPFWRVVRVEDGIFWNGGIGW